MDWPDEIPWLGWHPDPTLIWHTLRDAAITLAISGVAWIFVDLAQKGLNFNYPIHWIIGATGGFFFSCGFEGRERPPPSFFGIGDFAVSIVGSQGVLNIALILTGWFDWTVFGLVLCCQVFMYLIIFGGLLAVNKYLKRDIIRP